MKFVLRLLSVFLISSLLISSGCSKSSGGGGGGGGGGTTEANLVVTLNPAENTVQPAAAQTDFSLTVSIASTMPPQGVTIDVVVKKDDGSGTTVFTESKNSTSATNNFTITGTPSGVVCVTTVTVTSKTKATNKWTGSYRYSRK